MSNSISIGVIAEGPTDYIIIREALHHLVRERDFTLFPIQPEISETFEQIQGPTGTGWSGVYRQIALIGNFGPFLLSVNPLLSRYDMLIIHLDADVARETYDRGHLSFVDKDDLPCPPIPCPSSKQKNMKTCIRKCIVPRQRLDTLRNVIMGWMNLNANTLPHNIVLCTPADRSDAWVVAAFPRDNKNNRYRNLECVRSPENLLKRFGIKKNIRDYKERVECVLRECWPNVRKVCAEAERFSSDVIRAIK